MAVVYTTFCTDVIHEGHLNIINEAKKYGEVVVGVLSDEASIRFNRFPTLDFNARKKMIEEIPGVSRVIVQEEMEYDNVVKKLKPDYIIHGDNWLRGPMLTLRENAKNALAEYGGEVIDVPTSSSPEITRVERVAREKASMPDYRRGRLKKLIKLRPIVKAMEAHNGLTGLIVEETYVETSDGLDQFDAMWVSSLCDSTAKGKPDIELIDLSSRLRTIDEIMEVTTKPVIFDGDTGGLTEHFVYTVRSLERLGVSAVIIEDKIGLKQNSLFGTEVDQTQDSIEDFCHKISAGKAVQFTDEFMIIARIESLILEKGVDDALERARAYVKAGADGIMIHSRNEDPAEIFDFCDSFRKEDKDTPIVVVPTSYNEITENELAEHGINIVIYANQLTRSAFPAMRETARDILRYHRAKEVDDRLMPIKDIISMIKRL